MYGITRLSILEIASDEGIDVKIEKIPLCELENAKEVFLTSSSHLVCPVIKIDNKPISDGAFGLLTNRLKERFLKISKGQDIFFSNWLDEV